MNANEASGQETDEPTRPAHRNELAAAATEKTLKRARWEHLRLAACPGARHVNVTNYSYGVQAARSGEHTYTVSIGPDGLPTECTCPDDEYQPGPCKHAVAVAADRAVLDEAMHGGSDPSTDANQAIATDGGEVVGDTDESGLPAIESVGEHRARCTGCGRDGPLDLDGEAVILHTRECPRSDDGEGERR